MLVLLIGSSAGVPGGAAASQCAELVDLPALGAQLLRMLLSLYGMHTQAKPVTQY